MTLGKNKCRILKEIRQRIADENDIPYVTRECHYKGECRGTCPKCESELRYLEQQLALRASMGKRVALAALCAGMTFSAAGCGSFIPGTDRNEPKPGMEELSGMIEYPEPEPQEEPEVFETSGEVAYPDGPETGEIAYPEDPDLCPSEGFELTGDVAYPMETESNG